MTNKTKFIVFLPANDFTDASISIGNLQLGTTNGESIGPFVVSREAPGLLQLASTADTLVRPDPANQTSSRPIRDDERPEAELLAAESLAGMAGCKVRIKCWDDSDTTEPGPSACAGSEPVHDSAARPSLAWPPPGLDYLAPLNPKLEGDGVITLRQVSDDQFLTPAGYPVRFTGVTHVDDDEDPDDELFRTSRGDLVRIMHGGKDLTPFFETCRLSIDFGTPLAQAAGIRFAVPDYSTGPESRILEWMPVIESILITPHPPAKATPGWTGDLFCTLFDGRQVGGIWLSCDSEGQFKCHVETAITFWFGRTDAAPTPASPALRNEIRALTLFVLPQLLQSAV